MFGAYKHLWLRVNRYPIRSKLCGIKDWHSNFSYNFMVQWSWKVEIQVKLWGLRPRNFSRLLHWELAQVGFVRCTLWVHRSAYRTYSYLRIYCWLNKALFVVKKIIGSIAACHFPSIVLWILMVQNKKFYTASILKELYFVMFCTLSMIPGNTKMYFLRALLWEFFLHDRFQGVCDVQTCRGWIRILSKRRFVR